MTRVGLARCAWPIAITVLLIAGALAPAPDLRDAVSRGPAGADVALVRPAAYVALAPFCSVLDAMTLLGFRRHYAFAATVMALCVAGGLVRGRSRRLWARGLRGAIAGTLALLGVYVGTILVPRPIAGLRVADPDLLVVDFHSHTGASHDARARFTPAANRAWHQAAGYHAAYVTDHRTFEGVREAVHANPDRAGDGTVLLPGVEVRAHGLQVLVLGLTDPAMDRLTADLARHDAPLRQAFDLPVVFTIPGSLELMERLARTRMGDPVAIEVADGGTKGLHQLERDHARVVDVAERRNLAPVSGTNTHGWASAPNAWTLLRVPGWRALAPDALEARILEHLRADRFASTRVVERWAIDADVGDVMTLPAMAWRIFATLTPAERGAWFVWTWGVALLLGCRRRSARH